MGAAPGGAAGPPTGNGLAGGVAGRLFGPFAVLAARVGPADGSGLADGFSSGTADNGADDRLVATEWEGAIAAART